MSEARIILSMERSYRKLESMRRKARERDAPLRKAQRRQLEDFEPDREPN
jgi:hypothetical protein